MDSRERVKELRRYVDHLLRLRAPWAEAWDVVRRNVRPVRPWNVSGLGQRDIGLDDLLPGKIMDNSASRAVRILANGLFSGLTPTTRPWFSLRPVEAELMEIGPVRDWIWSAQEKIYSVFARSGFYRAQIDLDMDIAAFCTACMAQEPMELSGMRYQSIPIGTFAWDVDSRGRVNAVVRQLGIAARHLAQSCGLDKLSEGARRLAEQAPYQGVELVHVVMPREGRAPGRLDRLNKAWASYLYEESSGQLIEEGGFDVFPYICTRWENVGGEIYGRGIGFDVMPDVLMLQAVSKDQAEALRMVIKPVLKVPPALKSRLSVKLVPGAMVEAMPGEQVEPLYQVRPDLPAASGKINELRQAIREGFFNDLLLMIMYADKSNMTATEIAERQSERLSVLGPIIENHTVDNLDPCVSNCFYSLLQRGALDPVPGELEGVELHIEFTSLLAQAQKLPQAAAIRKTAETAQFLAQAWPEALDKFDADQAMDEISQIEGVPSRVIRPDDAVARLRRRRAELDEAARRQEEQARADRAGVETAAALSRAATGPAPAPLPGAEGGL